MRKNQVAIIITLCVLWIPFTIQAQSALSAKDIMIKVQKATKESFTSSIQRIKLSTCKYSVADNKMVCSDEPRNKVLESIVKNYGNDRQDSRAVSIIIEPKKEEGVGLLTYEYGKAGKDNDSWMFLPALGKVKRLASGGDSNDESGSFFGSEFSLEDMEDLKINEYTFQITGEENYKGRDVWVIEYTPNAERAKKSKYSKTTSWVDKERFISLKKNLYSQGKLYKQVAVSNIEKVDNVWLARKLTINNMTTHRMSSMSIVSVAFDKEVPDEFLTTRSLEDFSFREKNLTRFRSSLK
ncbi:outer membrane lipoprotein-sorting protein [Chitinophaga varians]|uniref:outer membrane lipoprotein-sorting protein n=1 Tax=Chitinophaga varians TaxID=2202339 RepID=UPI00165F2715|nr:outer membrane lipoprotein-sorting protein [Chitinophaga varians]MBC9915644.1 outer membrane lipoprotein-sorting protein [Chitinophaga varians]